MKRLTLICALSLLALTPTISEAQVRVGVAFPGIRVAVAPPALRHEVAPPAPSPRHRWIAGYWGWRGGTHVWINGQWLVPPAYGYVWEPARWENVGGAWMFHEGHWRTADQPDPVQVYQPPPPPVRQVIVDAPPPPPVDEIRPPPPFGRAAWIPGYWRWNGYRHDWVAGRWSPQPRGHDWQPPGWDRRGDGRWAYHEGHWRPKGEEWHRRHHHRDDDED